MNATQVEPSTAEAREYVGEQLSEWKMGKVSVCGMATPFGVRLCADYVSAGLNGFLMMATGALIGLAAYTFVDKLPHFFLDRYGVTAGVISLIGLVLYMLAFRLTPLAGIHASEHMVVHAIEKGVPLDLANVRTMPRVHPRCGTNIMGVAFIVLGLMEILKLVGWTHWTLVIAAIILGFKYGDKLGALLQDKLTTKDPTDAQLEKAIRVGALLVMNQLNYDIYKGWRKPEDRMPCVVTYLFQMGVVEFIVGNMLMKSVLDYWF